MSLGNEEKTNQKTTGIKILIADDDIPTRILLRAAISQWGYEVVEAKDGEEAWAMIQQPNPPRILILDWLMPKLDGTSLCARIIEAFANHQFYIILLTQVTGSANIIKGLESGADEFLTKPFNMMELRCRISVGMRIIKYENRLAEENNQLQANIAQIKSLSAMALDVSQKIYESYKSDDSNSNVNENAKQIKSLYKNLEQIIVDIKNIHFGSK